MFYFHLKDVVLNKRNHRNRVYTTLYLGIGGMYHVSHVYTCTCIYSYYISMFNLLIYILATPKTTPMYMYI